jgi:hypothetical protein
MDNGDLQPTKTLASLMAQGVQVVSFSPEQRDLETVFREINS